MKKNKEVFDLETGLLLPNDSSVLVSRSNKPSRCNYQFYNPDGELTLESEGSEPLMLSVRSRVGKEIYNTLKYDKSSKSASELFSEIKEALAGFVEYYETTVEEIKLQEQSEKEAEYQQQITDAMKLYDSIENPLIWLGSMIDWVTAGERANILISLLALSSQVILKHPISLIGIGEGSSGKNHVCETALSMIPKRFILNEKRPTLASMFRRAEEDPKYYDGKIVNYGDMGGDSDQDEVEDTKNILKELQTDGELCRPVTIKTSDGFEVVDLVLKGHPCLLYQTVPNYTFDDQELSRSILITPRQDNRREFNLMSTFLELVNGVTYNKHESVKNKLSEVMPFVVEGLRNRFSTVTIVNPYMELIEDFVGTNPYYKRDLPKFNSVLKVITAYNSSGRPVYTVNGCKVMFTTKEDVLLFITLFDDYRESIMNNTTKKAMEILNDLRENIDDWCYDFEEDEAVFSAGITIAKYMEVGNVKVSLRSTQKYFKELRENAYLTIVGKQGNSSLYGLAKDKVEKTVELKDLSDKAKEIIRDEYGSDMLHIVLTDTVDDKLSVFCQHTSISKPPWE